MGIGCQTRHQVHHEVSQPLVAIVLYLIRLRRIELVNHGLYDCSHTTGPCLSEISSGFDHFLMLGDELNAPLNEICEKSFVDIDFVTDELSN